MDAGAGDRYRGRRIQRDDGRRPSGAACRRPGLLMSVSSRNPTARREELAYGTRCDEHLLNVTAGLMSALPDEPSHFLDWLRVRDPSAHQGTFAPRRVYGDYLEELLTSSVSQS